MGKTQAERLEEATANAKEVLDALRAAMKECRELCSAVDVRVLAIQKVVEATVHDQIKAEVARQSAFLSEGMTKARDKIEATLTREVTSMLRNAKSAVIDGEVANRRAAARRGRRLPPQAR